VQGIDTKNSGFAIRNSDDSTLEALVTAFEVNSPVDCFLIVLFKIVVNHNDRFRN
jgi:hypothetical protein